jgi:hypothetical protein
VKPYFSFYPFPETCFLAGSCSRANAASAGIGYSTPPIEPPTVMRDE